MDEQLAYVWGDHITVEQPGIAAVTLEKWQVKTTKDQIS